MGNSNTTQEVWFQTTSVPYEDLEFSKLLWQNGNGASQAEVDIDVSRQGVKYIWLHEMIIFIPGGGTTVVTINGKETILSMPDMVDNFLLHFPINYVIDGARMHIVSTRIGSAINVSYQKVNTKNRVE